MKVKRLPAESEDKKFDKQRRVYYTNTMLLRARDSLPFIYMGWNKTGGYIK